MKDSRLTVERSTTIMKGLGGCMAFLLAICLVTACGSRQESRLRKAGRQQEKAAAAVDKRPLPERLMDTSIVVRVDGDGGISVQGRPLGENEALDLAIRNALVRDRKNWPVTVLMDPRQSVAMVEPVVAAANKARPGLVNVIAWESPPGEGDQG